MVSKIAALLLVTSCRGEGINHHTSAGQLDLSATSPVDLVDGPTDDDDTGENRDRPNYDEALYQKLVLGKHETVDLVDGPTDDDDTGENRDRPNYDEALYQKLVLGKHEKDEFVDDYDSRKPTREWSVADTTKNPYGHAHCEFVWPGIKDEAAKRTAAKLQQVLGEDAPPDIVIKYRGIILHKGSSLEKFTVQLPYPMSRFLEKQLEVTIKEVKKATGDLVKNETIKCLSWKDTLKKAYTAIKSVHKDEQSVAEECVQKTRDWMDSDNSKGKPVSDFIYHGTGKRPGGKPIKVAFLFHGLNDITTTNGVDQMYMMYGDMCRQLADGHDDWLLVAVAPMYQDQIILRKLYMHMGMLYTHQYLHQSWVRPVVEELLGQKRAPELLFAGFSMGGILATLSAITFRNLHTAEFRVPLPALDPFRRKDNQCAHDAVTEVKAKVRANIKRKVHAAAGAASVGERYLDVHLEALSVCFRADARGKGKVIQDSNAPRADVRGLATFASPLHGLRAGLASPRVTIWAMNFQQWFAFNNKYEQANVIEVLDIVMPTELSVIHGKTRTHLLGIIHATDGSVFAKESTFKAYHVNHVQDGVVGLQGDQREIEMGAFGPTVYEFDEMNKSENLEPSYTCEFDKKPAHKNAVNQFGELPYEHSKMWLLEDKKHDKLLNAVDLRISGLLVLGLTNDKTAKVVRLVNALLTMDKTAVTQTKEQGKKDQMRIGMNRENINDIKTFLEYLNPESRNHLGVVGGQLWEWGPAKVSPGAELDEFKAQYKAKLGRLHVILTTVLYGVFGGTGSAAGFQCEKDQKQFTFKEDDGDEALVKPAEISADSKEWFFMRKFEHEKSEARKALRGHMVYGIIAEELDRPDKRRLKYQSKKNGFRKQLKKQLKFGIISDVRATVRGFLASPGFIRSESSDPQIKKYRHKRTTFPEVKKESTDSGVWTSRSKMLSNIGSIHD